MKKPRLISRFLLWCSGLPLKINIREVDSISILDLKGAVVFDSGLALRNEVLRLLAMGKKNLLLNLEGVTRIDDSGIACLVGVHQSARAAKGSAKFLKPSKCVREWGAPYSPFWLEGYDDESKALASFKQ